MIKPPQKYALFFEAQNFFAATVALRTPQSSKILYFWRYGIKNISLGQKFNP
jgi:hypothetical protein